MGSKRPTVPEDIKGRIIEKSGGHTFALFGLAQAYPLPSYRCFLICFFLIFIVKPITLEFYLGNLTMVSFLICIYYVERIFFFNIYHSSLFPCFLYVFCRLINLSNLWKKLISLIRDISIRVDL